jgi:hypothetical protein
MTATGSPTDQPSAAAEDPVGHDQIAAIVAGHHHDPHAVLGAHPGPDGLIVRALRPLASAVFTRASSRRRCRLTRLATTGWLSAILRTAPS